MKVLKLLDDVFQRSTIWIPLPYLKADTVSLYGSTCVPASRLYWPALIDFNLHRDCVTYYLCHWPTETVSKVTWMDFDLLLEPHWSNKHHCVHRLWFMIQERTCFWCRSYIDMFYMVIKYKILLRPNTSLFTRKHLNYFQLYVVISLDRLQHCCYSLFQIFCSLDTTNTQTVNSSSAASLGAFSPNLTHLPTFYERQWKGKINQRVPLANQILAEATRGNKVWEKSAEGSRGCRNAAGSHWVMTQERKCS